MSGENLDNLLQNPLSKAFLRRWRSEKTDLNFLIKLLTSGSYTPLLLYQIALFLYFPIWLIFKTLIYLSLTAMPLAGAGGGFYGNFLPTEYP